MAENSTNTPNNEEKRWYEKISWNYVLGGLLLLFALMYFSQNGCGTTKKTSSEDEEMAANSPFTQLRKSMKKVRAEEKRREAALNDVNNFYDDVVDPEVNGATKKSDDGNCHKKGCDGTCGLNHSVIDNSTNQTVIINTGTTTKPASTSGGGKKNSGGGYKKPEPKTDPTPKQDSPKTETAPKPCPKTVDMDDNNGTISVNGKTYYIYNHGTYSPLGDDGTPREGFLFNKRNSRYYKLAGVE